MCRIHDQLGVSCSQQCSKISHCNPPFYIWAFEEQPSLKKGMSPNNMPIKHFCAYFTFGMFSNGRDLMCCLWKNIYK